MHIPLPASAQRLTSRAVLLLLVAAIASVGLLTIATATPAPAAESQSEWPSMTLTYAIEGKFGGLDQPTTVQTWQLSYDDQHHWSKERVADTGEPRTVGEIHRLEGTTFSTYSAESGTTVSNEKPNVAVDWWLLPGREVKLQDQGYEEEPDPERSLVRYTKTESWPCDRTIPESVGVTQPDSCATDDTFEVTESVLYRTDVTPMLPIELTTAFNGDVTSTITVSDVQFNTE